MKVPMALYDSVAAASGSGGYLTLSASALYCIANTQSSLSGLSAQIAYFIGSHVAIKHVSCGDSLLSWFRHCVQQSAHVRCHTTLFIPHLSTRQPRPIPLQPLRMRRQPCLWGPFNGSQINCYHAQTPHICTSLDFLGVINCCGS
jgi:hypothetical protein